MKYGTQDFGSQGIVAGIRECGAGLLDVEAGTTGPSTEITVG